MLSDLRVLLNLLLLNKHYQFILSYKVANVQLIYESFI
jgi:hypothetical protein